MPVWRAAQRYEAEGKSVVIVAGERYGMGSSRDWAAKGTALLGVRAVLASGFERIHRSNLINMGILPLRLPDDQLPQDLGLKPSDTIAISADVGQVDPRAPVPVHVKRRDGDELLLTAVAAIETSLEVQVLEAGGMLPFILNRSLEESLRLKPVA